MIRIDGQRYIEIEDSINQLMDLASSPKQDKQSERMQAALQTKISALKASMTPAEWRNARTDMARRQLGMGDSPNVRSRMPESSAREWREFATTDNFKRYVEPRETRANEGGTQSISWTQGPAGGYLAAPSGIHSRMLGVLKQYDELFDPEFHTPVETATGTVTTVPVWDDTENASTIVTETTDSSEVDVDQFLNVELGTYMFRTGYVGVTLELLQDSNWPWMDLMEAVFAGRHARGIGKYLVTGSGTGQPTGIFTAAVANGAPVVVAGGDSVNSGNADSGSNSVGTPDLSAAFGKLNWMYRRNSVWLMNDQTLISLLGLLDKQGRPTVRTYIDESDGTEHYRIFGRPVCISPSASNATSAANPILLYDPRYFFVRSVPSMTFVRKFQENVNLVLQGEVGFQSFARYDCNLAPIVAAQPHCCIIQCHS